MASYSVGAIHVEVIEDGINRGEPSRFFVGQPEAAWREFVELDDEGQVRTPIQCLLVRSGDRLALLDTGFGLDERSPETPGIFGKRGRLIPELARLGVTPEQIDVVVLSHGHADHVGGTVDVADQRPSFPRARYVMGAADFTHFTSAETQAEVPFSAGQLLPLEARGQLELNDGELEVLPGVRLLPAPGHTPGHVCVAITSGSEHALYTGDLMHQVAQIIHPDWYPIWDWMPPLAMQSRRRVLEQARRDGALVFTAHLPSPGVGHIGEEWEPVS